MANAGLLAGLGAGLEYFVKSRDKDEDREKDFELAKRKAELANKLEMDLLQKKEEFAKTFPKYTHFMKTAEGNIVGLNERGQMQEVFQETPEGRELLKQKLEGDTAYKQANAAAALAMAEGRPGLLAAQTSLVQAKTANLGKPKVSNRKPVNEVDEALFQKNVDEAFARQYGKPDATTITAADAELAKSTLADPNASPARKKGAQAALQEWQARQTARKQIEDKLRPMYNVVKTPQPMGLVAPAQASEEDDTEEDNPFGDIE